MLETKCIGDNLKMLVTVLVIFVTDIPYFLSLASAANIYICKIPWYVIRILNLSPKLKKLSPTVSQQHHDITNITVVFKNEVYILVEFIGFDWTVQY